METMEFKGLHNSPSKCGLEIHKRTDGKAVIILTELPDNPGTSVTNFVEQLATKVYMERLMMPVKAEDIIWIEHYPAESRLGDEETWDIVELMFHEDYKRFQRPKWSRFQKADVDELISQ